MARRKRKEEEPDWVPPDFDEVSFMRKEIENARVALVVVGWAVAGAIIGYLLYVFVHPAVGFLVGLASFAGLYFVLPALGLSTQGFKRRDWFSQGYIYFFCWLAFFILILNPPFGDHTAPGVQFIAAASYNPGGMPDPLSHTIFCVPARAGATSIVGGSNSTLYALFRATDNVGVRSVHVQSFSNTQGTTNLTAANVSGLASPCSNSPNGTTNLPETYAVRLVSPGDTVTITVTATDGAGFSTTDSFRIQPAT